jgi:vitamin B12 transporter
LSLTALLAPSVCGALADTPVEEGEGPIVVTATRIPTPQAEIASSITVVTADEIADRQVETLPDLLKQTPGLNVVQTGGPGGQTSVFMRGTNSNHTKVLVDGIDVSDPSNPGGAFDFSQLLTEDIEKVEILRGPQSGLYGSDAIGGVINIITPSGSGPAQVHASLEGGSFDTFNQSAGVQGSEDALHYAANVEHFHAGATPVTPLDLLAPGTRRIDDYDDNLSASTKLGFEVTQHFDLGLVARYTDTHLRLTEDNYDDYPLVFPDTAQSANDTIQYFTRATAHLSSFGGALDQTLGAAYSNLKSSDFSPGAARSDAFGQRVKFDWQGDIRLGDQQQLVLGAEHQRDAITSPLSAGTKIDSGYAELQSGYGRALFDTVSVRYDDNDRFGSKVTYRFAPAYLIEETGTKIKASIGTGFKAPTLEQLFQSFPAFDFYANPDLKPESSLGYDFGFEQALFGDALKFGATYFHNHIKNLISDNADFTSYANVGRAMTRGAESFLAYRPIRDLTLRLDYTYTEAIDQIAQQELLRRPKHNATFNAAFSLSARWSLNATVLGTGSWMDGNRDFTNALPLTAPGFVTVNAATTYVLTNHWSVFGKVDNLLNHHYEDPIGFLQPSLGAYAGVKAKF